MKVEKKSAEKYTSKTMKVKHSLSPKMMVCNGVIDHILAALAELVTVAEAAEIRGTSSGSIYELIERNRLSVIEIADLKLLLRSEVESFERGKPGPKSKMEREFV